MIQSLDMMLWWKYHNATFDAAVNRTIVSSGVSACVLCVYVFYISVLVLVFVFCLLSVVCYYVCSVYLCVLVCVYISLTVCGAFLRM